MVVEAVESPAAIDAGAAVDLEAQVDVRLDELIIGRPLEFPLYDDKSVLLLAAGSTITLEARRLLEQRGITQVRVHPRDAARLRLSADAAPSDENLIFDCQVAEKLDRMIDSGLLSVPNVGDPVRNRVAAHGRKGYDAGRRQTLADQKQATIDSLEDMMRKAVRGQMVSSTLVTQIAAQYLGRMVMDADCVLSVAMEAARDPVLAEHCLKMATLGMAVGVEVGLDEDNCKRIFLAGLIHDWGMAKVPTELRNAPRMLTEYELFQIRKHPLHTLEMLEHMPRVPPMIPMIVYQVHERPNGTGYPRRRRGEQIHPFARILAVADMYAALTEDRPHRKRLMPYAAMECLIHLAKTRDVDGEMVRALLHTLSLFPIGSFVTLDDGSVARVLRRNGDKYTTPIVQVVQDPLGAAVPTDRDEAIVDLSQSERKIIQALPAPGRSESALSPDVLIPVRPPN
jgi:HD-GYP domain-containing protein (c-di-GMP phosphodiesterase class II)